MPVVQKMMKIDIMMKETSCWSDKMKEMTAPKTHMMTTLYTLIPGTREIKYGRGTTVSDVESHYQCTWSHSARECSHCAFPKPKNSQMPVKGSHESF